ncbi:MAG: energy transducer TonB [Gemmatimonadaceae bacterium]
MDLAAERLNEVKPEHPREGGRKLSGEVVAQFAVDTAGLADMSTFRTVRSAHPLLAEAVRSAIPQFRFAPAVLGGRKVKQLVQQRFIFR